MRIEGIKIHNYRQYSDVDITFPKTDNDVQIIVGKNGVGKTTFLNAINWCLYGDEPHAYSEESSLPLRNLKADDNEDVFVELEISAEDGAFITFRRSAGTNLKVIEKRKSGESQSYWGTDADMVVDNFVPQVIREFFFFDGEQLDNYFLDVKTRNIKNKISILSHMTILENIYEDLKTKYRSVKQKAGSKDKNIDVINNKIENLRKSLESENRREEGLNENITQAKEDLKLLNDILKGVPDIENLESRRDKAKIDKERFEQNIENAEKDRRELFLLESPYVLLKPAMDYVLNDIQYKINHNELPKPIDDEVIVKCLENRVCEICGRPLDEHTYNKLNTSLTDYKISSEQSKQLLSLNSKLQVNKAVADGYNNKYKKLVESYKFALNSFNNSSKDFKEIDEQYAQFNDPKLKEKHFNRKDKERNIWDDENSLISCKANIKSIEKELDDLDKELTVAMDKNEKTRVFRKKKVFLRDALDLIERTKDEIITDTKNRIEEITKNTFFDLTWKKSTYSDIRIDDSYQLKLIHALTSSNSLGSASAAERELLVLAFTLGVHSISQFDSSLLIDTPLARVSDEHRVNFTNVLLEISGNKQIILLLTPAEYSEDIQEVLDNEDITRYQIVMGEDEYESYIEELM